ncbi:uncharacterized protein ACWYII_046222 [Salvelinus alpinus]
MEGFNKAQVLTTSRDLSEENTVAHAALRFGFEKLLYLSACEPAKQEEAAEKGPVVIQDAEKVTVVTIEEAAEEGPVMMEEAEKVTMVNMEDAVEGPVVTDAEKVTMEEGTDPNQGRCHPFSPLSPGPPGFNPCLP